MRGTARIRPLPQAPVTPSPPRLLASWSPADLVDGVRAQVASNRLAAIAPVLDTQGAAARDQNQGKGKGKRKENTPSVEASRWPPLHQPLAISPS